MHLVTAFAKSSLYYILNILICNLFVNINIFILLKILLKIIFIMGILMLYYTEATFISFCRVVDYN